MDSIRDLLSNGDCEKIIERFVAASGDDTAAIKIISYDAEIIPGHPGYIGDYSYLRITYQRTKQDRIEMARFFVKSTPRYDAELRKMVEACGIFRKEAVFYDKLHAHYQRDPVKVNKWAPDCYLARNELIVLEDLSQTRYRTMPFQKLFREQHMQLVFDRLAQMHACAIEFEVNQLNGRSIDAVYGEEILFETTFTPTSGWFVAGMKGILTVALERSHYSKDPTKRAIIEEQMMSRMEHIYALSKPTDQFRCTVVHRDLWFNNFMFQPAPKDTDCDNPLDCLLIDFQLARYLPPAVDFQCALYLLTDRAQREQQRERFIEFYYNSFQQKLALLGLDAALLLPRAQFEETLAHYRLVGLVWAGVLHGFVNFPQGMMDDLHQSDSDTYTRMSMVNRDDFILKYYDCDRFYRDRMDDVVNETIEYLFNFHH
ncbi:uncharacterized protein LOC125949578 [Anopheles darlingi]|uniref:uncharacterized protein LOC125949578 n=1 Tax=Anopheles darlingi TaxID=43151 RepID=UPI0021003759|nr:uncharacterized protein LOC125949578 [Anopheles darlingi]